MSSQDKRQRPEALSEFASKPLPWPWRTATGLAGAVAAQPRGAFPNLPGHGTFKAFLQESPAHNPERGVEEMVPAVPAHLDPVADQPQVALVDGGGGVERIPWRLVGSQPAGGS
jgi:hypothetical protein